MITSRMTIETPSSKRVHLKRLAFAADVFDGCLESRNAKSCSESSVCCSFKAYSSTAGASVIATTIGACTVASTYSGAGADVVYMDGHATELGSSDGIGGVCQLRDSRPLTCA